jgi:hypothetical protein
MAERRTFREKVRNAARKSYLLLEKLSPERAVSRMRLNRELVKILNSKAMHNYKIDWERVKELVTAGASVNIRAYNFKTILHYAAVAGRTDICAFLLANGANLNAKDKYGRSAIQQSLSLMELSKYGREWQKTVKFLNYSGPLMQLLGKEEFKEFLPSFAECTGL